MTLRIGLEARQVDDGEFGNEARKLWQFGADQKLADEQRVPGELGEDAGLDGEFAVGAAIEVLRVERLAFGVGDEILAQRLELLRR